MASTFSANNVPNFIGKNYQTALKNSIESILTNPTNSSSLLINFQQLIQSKQNPPLESIWAFSALTFNTQNSVKIQPLDKILAIKHLFQLIVSYSASCSVVKSVSLLAPVVYSLHKFIIEVKDFDLGIKVEKKVKSEITSLVDSVVGYVNVCCESGFEDFSESLVRPLSELSSLWVGKDNGECLRLFFPLLSDGCVQRIGVDECEMVELAGFVITEVFLLKVCWKVREGFGEKMRDELKYWIVGSVTGFRNSYFYETLASMMLEPVLPTASIVNIEHGEGLRKILFDALILAEYSFLSPEHLDQLPGKHAKRVNLTRLMVVDEAISFLREHGKTTEAFSYLNAFSVSCLPAQIIKLVRGEIGNEFSASEPNGSSPRAFLRWILNIENKGIKIFEDDMTDYRAKLMSTDMREEMEQLGRNPESDLLFSIDKTGEEENRNREDEDVSKGMSAAFMAAAHSIESSELGGRKRKSKKDVKKKKVKFVKYAVLEDSPLPGNSNSGSEIENPDSSEDD